MNKKEGKKNWEEMKKIACEITGLIIERKRIRKRINKLLEEYKERRDR